MGKLSMNKTEWEARLARAVSRLGAEQRRKVFELLGDPPSMNKLDDTFWTQSGIEWRKALSPELEKIYLDRAAELLGNIGVSVDWALVNQSAVQWARKYGYDLVKGINDNTRKVLQDKVGQWFAKPTTLAELRKDIAPLYGPDRAESIAITEVTRASSMGENETAKLLGQQGVKMRPVWHASNDKDTCEEYCVPADNKAGDEPIPGGAYGGQTWLDMFPDGPPAHPRCRCGLGHELVTNGQD